MKINVIVVDDEVIIRMGLSKFLKELHPDIQLCGIFQDGAEALEFIKNNTVHILITDMKMTNVNGEELIQNVRKISKFTKIIIISGYRNFEYALVALKYNVHNYITKPINLKELKELILDVYNEIKEENLSYHDKNHLNYMLHKILIDIYKNEISSDELKHLISANKYCTELADNKYTLFSIKILELEDYLNNFWKYELNNLYNACNNIFNMYSDRHYVFNVDSFNNELKYIFICDKKYNPEEKIFEYVDNLEKIMNFKISFQIQFIANNVYELMQKFSCITKKKQENNDNILILKAKQFINQNYNKDISLFTVADHVQLNAMYFSRFFKAQTGVTFIDYLIDVRMNRAIELLKTRKYTGMEICREVGYQSYSYFINVFKQTTGYSPKEFLRRME